MMETCYTLVSFTSVIDSHTEDNPSPETSCKASFFSLFSVSVEEPGLIVISSRSPTCWLTEHSTSLYLPEESLMNISLQYIFSPGSGQYRYSYIAAAKMPPRMGPTQYTYSKGRTSLRLASFVKCARVHPNEFFSLSQVELAYTSGNSVHPKNSWETINQRVYNTVQN